MLLCTCWRRRQQLLGPGALSPARARGGLAAMSGGNGDGPAKRRQSGGAAIARLAGETSDNMKKPNDGGAPLYFTRSLPLSLPGTV